jgi:hypothetical protein
MLDCGTTITAVAPWVLARLNATPGPTVQTQTAAGSVSVQYYEISFTIYGATPGGTDLSRLDWTVTNLTEDPDDVDVLFGLDLFREIVVTIDGPALIFNLDF